MHFHLPKPLHGWREFTGEVGIIVIGLLIALAVQQGVDAIVRRARDAKGGLAPLAFGRLSPEEGGAVLATLTILDRDRGDVLIAGRDLIGTAATLGVRSKVSDAQVKSDFKSRYGICSQE